MIKLSRKQIREGLATTPIESILGKDVSRELTAKQKRFALEIASGNTKAEAYRRAYKKDAAPSSVRSDPYRIASNPRIAHEIEAYQAAIEAARYRTPAALRELVIQSLVSVIINPETKDSVKVSAAKVLGTVTEVAAFTERKEIKTISSSESAKAKILDDLKRIIKSSAEDANVIEAQADSLLAELMPEASDIVEAGGSNPTVPAPPQTDSEAPPSPEHTIPHKQSSVPPIFDPTPPSVLSADDGPTPSSMEDPPMSFETGPMSGDGI